jgi:hypothetical protein
LRINTAWIWVLLARALLDQLSTARELPAQHSRRLVGRPHFDDEAAGQQSRERSRVDLVSLRGRQVMHRARLGQHDPPDMRPQHARDRPRIRGRSQRDRGSRSQTLREQLQRLGRGRDPTARSQPPVLDQRDLAEIAMHVEPDKAHAPLLSLPTMSGDRAGDRGSYGYVLSAHPGTRGGGHLHSTGSQLKPTGGLPNRRSPMSPRPGTTGDATRARGQNRHGSAASSCPYIPFDPQAANLMFMLVSRRYERASLIVTSNKPFSGWGEIFGDDIVAAAMIDRLVHHADILALKRDSYRLKDRDLAHPATPAD